VGCTMMTILSWTHLYLCHWAAAAAAVRALSRDTLTLATPCTHPQPHSEASPGVLTNCGDITQAAG
jgi:hypothetical protein